MNLSELISKCGDRFCALFRGQHYPKDQLWYASYISDRGMNEYEIKPWYDPFKIPYVEPKWICGVTPEQAVQSLINELTKLKLI